MFSSAEKQSAYSSNSAVGDTTQELGPLGLSADDFKTVLATLKKRSGCLLLANPDRPLRGHVTDRTTQNTLLGLLGPKKKTESGNASNGNEAKKSSSKNNLKNKIDAEEAAIKTVFEIMASTSPSEDNPLKDVVISANPWNMQSEQQLEYFFREGVCLDVDYTNVKYGRYLGDEDTGSCPFVLTVRFEIRILQCLLLNFSWFCNRLYKVMKELNVESRASSTSIVFTDTLALNNGWADMMVKHRISQDNVAAALKFMMTEYSTVHNKIKNSGKTPTYFAVEFEMVDNAIGLADSDIEHQGTACVEWKCFNSIKKNAGEEFGTNNFQQRRFGTLFGGFSAAETEIEDDGVTSANNAAAAVDIIKDFGASAKDNIGSSKIFESDNSSWMKSIIEGDGGSTVEFTKYEKFRSGTSTVTVSQSSAVSLAAMAKGNESKVLVDSMIKFIDDSVKTIVDPCMYNSDDCVFSENQEDNYSNYKDVYLAAICSNPSNIYRVVCHLFTNLLLPRLRNPVRDTKQINSLSIGNGKTKVTTEYGYGDVQYGIPQYAKGKVKISGKRSCECRKMCKEPRCFDNSRLANNNGGSRPDPADKRRHNSHRSNAYDFRFFDKIKNKVIQLSNKKMSAEEESTMDHDFLAQDKKAFDLLSKCFLSAGLHHIYCPDVLMVHRGNNFNIDLKNNKLDCITETNQSEEITSSQTVNAKEALTDITGNKLRKGADIVEHLKSLGISLREFSNKTSRVVRNLNELTSKLCNTSFSTDMDIIGAVLCYINNVMPTLETILSFVNIEELQKPFDELTACMSESGSNNKSVGKRKLRASFALFRVMAKFLLRNYNASVAAAINRRGYLTNTATLTGYRFKSDGNVIYYHETIAAVSSCIAYADYFSSRSSDADGENSNENGISNIDGTVASLMGDFSDNSNNGNSFDPKKNGSGGGDYSETFMKLFANELLGGKNDEDDEEEEMVPSPSKEELMPPPPKSPKKRSLSGSDEENQDCAKKHYKIEEEEEQVF